MLLAPKPKAYFDWEFVVSSAKFGAVKSCWRENAVFPGHRSGLPDLNPLAGLERDLIEVVRVVHVLGLKVCRHDWLPESQHRDDV